MTMSDEADSRRGPPHNPHVRKVVDRQKQMVAKLTREEQTSGFRGWHERGYLPHRDEPGLIQFVTFRLADSFPAELRHEWEQLLKIEDERIRRTELEAYLDLGHGACYLRDPRVAEMTAKALQHFDGERYRLIAWTVMPNHVHVLFQTTAQPMSKVIQSWKGFTGWKTNQILELTGDLWQEDYWDTYMRDDEHEQRTIRYLLNNPVKAKLTDRWQDWPWCGWNREAG